MKATIKEQETISLEGLKRYELNSSTCRILMDVGMYNSLLDPMLWTEDEEYNLYEGYGDAGEVFKCIGCFDIEGYKKMLAEVSQEVIDEYAMPILRDYGIAAIKAVGIDSPKYYNYSTDTLDFDVYLTDDFRQKFTENMERFRENESLQEYIEENWWHRSGFVSFMPKSMDEIASFKDEDRCLACYITFALLVGGYKNNFPEERVDLEMHYQVNDRCPSVFSNVYLYCSDEWAELFNEESELKIMIRETTQKIGAPWKTHEMKDCTDFEGNIETEAARFIVWATDMNYTPQDIRSLAA